MRRFLAPLLALAVAGSAHAQTVVLVRHGEKAEGNDPELSAAGQARAQALMGELKGMRLTRILATPPKRTQQTGAPTAAAAGLTVEPVSLEGGGVAHIARVAAEVRKAKAGETVLVVGHSNTVPEIARALGDPAPVALTDCDYDSLTVIDLSKTPPAVTHKRYGAPTKAC
jgi:broad specificity phosphatase PhoE